MILLISKKSKDFDDKLKNFNKKKITSNKTKHVLYENELNELSKRLTKDLINGYKILNSAKYFSSGIF